MTVRYPEYYENFSCIAGECEDTCCAGWEIDIDDASYEYYMQIPGKFGERLKNSIKEYQPDDDGRYEMHGFILKEGKRCPFLNSDNLCDMILQLGEDAICDVCTNTPRNFIEYGNAREISISPSCAEAGRLIFSDSKKTRFIEKETDDLLDFEESEEELAAADAIRSARDRAISILQDRETNIYQRIVKFLAYSEKVQECFNRGEFKDIPEKNSVKDIKLDIERLGTLQETTYYSLFRERMKSFRELESMNEEWGLYLERMEALFFEEGKGRARYENTFQDFREYLKEQGREYQIEHLMVYYAFLFLARCVDDFNFWGKAQFCACSFLMIRDMALERFYQNGGRFLTEDFVDVVRIYAKEIEHSEENLEFLGDEFLFEDIYQCKALYKQI
ncbi:MAG: hypothetical protein HFH73_02410 [Lachnospiraceae bacterium]|nr:hypothetical protein [Lachnospiraceae bacterium]